MTESPDSIATTYTSSLPEDYSLQAADFAVIGVYFAFILAVGIWVRCKWHANLISTFFTFDWRRNRVDKTIF